jgi:hypothetical protein
MVKVFPAIVIVPIRTGPVLAATEYCTVPFPLPLEPPVTVIHESLLTAVHGQPVMLVTPTLPVEPLIGLLAEVADIE